MSHYHWIFSKLFSIANTASNKNVQVKTLYYEMKLKNRKLEGGDWKKKCRWHCMWTCVLTQITYKPRQLLELIFQQLVGYSQYHYLRHSYLQYSTIKYFPSLTSLQMLFAKKELKNLTAQMKYLWTDQSLSSNTLNLHEEVSLFPHQVLLPKNMAIFQLCICFVFSSTENFQQLLLFLIFIHFQIYCCNYILN